MKRRFKNAMTKSINHARSTSLLRDCEDLRHNLIQRKSDLETKLQKVDEKIRELRAVAL
jgi:hypothetical protein